MNDSSSLTGYSAKAWHMIQRAKRDGFDRKGYAQRMTDDYCKPWPTPHSPNTLERPDFKPLPSREE